MRIYTKRPYPIFVERLQNFQMHAEKYVKEKGDSYVAEHPVGTGPYRFVDWKRGSEINVERNDSYWGPKAFIPHAKFRIIPDVATSVAELLAGNIDVIRYVPTDQIATINKSGRATAKVQRILRVQYIALDTVGRSGQTPFTDKRVRQAANYAMDSDTYIARLQPMLLSHTAGLPTSYDPFGRRSPKDLEGYDRDVVPRYPLVAPPR